MTLSPKIAQGGDLASSMTVFFTAGYPCYITDLRFSSRAAGQTVRVQNQPTGGTAVDWHPVWPLDADEVGIHLSDGERFLMATGDALLASATSGSAVGWTLSVNEDR